MKIGYACINNTLAEQGIQVNRSFIKKTFAAKGITYASETALKNIADLSKVIDWNIAHGIGLYRMSSDMFPWMSEYELGQLPGISAIETILRRAGEKARSAGLRLTYHPGPFNVLASPNDQVVIKTIKELTQHAEVMDMLGLPRTPECKINIHVGGSYGNKSEAMDRFIKNFQRLPEKVRQRLTIENDDKANMFSVADLLYIHERTGIPVVFDFLHHQFCTGNLQERDALAMALQTWPRSITPVVHFSSSKKRYEDKNAVETAHADFIYEKINLYGLKADVMLEAKAKELAVGKYLKDYRVRKAAVQSN